MIDQPILNTGSSPETSALARQGQNPIQPPLYDISKERAKYDYIISRWKEEKEATLTRRRLRENKRNVLEERQKGSILEDETIIPDRTIDLNIRRGSTQYINYVAKSKRNLIMTSVDEPSLDTESLELWFTRGMRYPDWKRPWFKLVDSMQLHGGAAVEVVYDPSKPFNCAVEFIERDMLLIPLATRNIQSLPCLLRAYDLTILQLEEFAELFGFNPEAVKAIQAKFTDQTTFVTVYRVLCKKTGVVYNCWYSQDYTAGLLRDYKPHEIGLYEFDPAAIKDQALSQDWQVTRMAPVDPMNPNAAPTLAAKPKLLKNYPITWFQYAITENEEILKEQGRAALDVHVQEALTHLLTNTVNSSTRASGLYGSAVDEPGQDPQLRELGRIKPGTIMNRGVTLWQPPWPSAIILAIMQALDVRKANESGNTDFAAVARKDANKTATEMDLSAQQSQEQAGVKTEMFSSPYLDVQTLCFLIATHQAIFLLAPRPTHPELLFESYNLQAAGDIEIIKRGEDRQNAKEFFNIIRGTPAADKLLSFLLDHFFPDQADEWKAALNSGNKDQMILELVNVLKSLPMDELKLSPEQQSALGSIIAAAQGMVEQSNNGNVSQASQSSGANPPSGGNAPR